MNLKVPYNFVPLNKKVVSPYWTDHISHDMPFKDGRSGTLKLTLTAESPIFVKQGSEKEEGADRKTEVQTKPYEFERDAGGNYFIPGSSIRGMVRSVLETLSFGRMIGRVGARRYALRDLSGVMKDKYLANFKVNADVPIRGGWLRLDKSTGKYILRDCDIPGRISHRHMEAESGVNISKYFSEGGRFNQKKDSEKAGKRKHQLFKENGKESWLNAIHDFAFTADSAGRKIYEVAKATDQESTIEPGRIVVTGQPGPRKQIFNKKKKELEWKGKQLEFIFWEGSRQEEITVPDKVVEDFKYAYFDHLSERQQSIDYRWLMEQLRDREEIEIPVFYKRGVSEDGQPTVEHFGLSYLYKLPYDYTVEESIENNQKETAHQPDLADAIFGAIEDKDINVSSLRGRVQISHAVAQNATEQGEVKLVLSEPRATFYPTYMKQKVSDDGTVHGYKTLMDKNAEIAGRKRYPLLQNGTRPSRPPGNENDKISTSIKPLGIGAQFTCEVHYHNLKDIELGALLSALTFHGCPAARHQIGMAKAYGYGKVKVKADGIAKDKLEKCMLQFEAYMNTEVYDDGQWRDHPIVREILSMSVPVEKTQVPVLDANYPYNDLEEFRGLKGGKVRRETRPKEGLRRHSEMRGEGIDTLCNLIQNDAVMIGQFMDEIERERKAYQNNIAYNPERTKRTVTESERAVADLIKQRLTTEINRHAEKLEQLQQQQAAVEAEAEEKRVAERRRKQQQQAAVEAEAEEKRIADRRRKQQQQAAVEAEAEEKRIADRRRKQQQKAKANGLNLDDLKIDRNAIKNLKKVVDIYLEKLRNKKVRDFTDKDWLLPESDWDELTEKIKKVYASGKAKKTAFTGKQLAHTQSIIAGYLGENGMRKLFDNLN